MAGVRPLGGGVALALVLLSASAHADVKACIAASESGQHARAAGKLREAQSQFLACAEASCPSLVRRDCQQWRGEIAQTMPSVVFAARDKAGKDLFDVVVTMDGEALVTKLDGKAVPVDPGKHVFRFEVAGTPPLVAIETVLVRENERARNVTALVEGPRVRAGDEVMNPATAEPPTASPPTSGPRSERRGHAVLPWVVAGVGAAALVTGVVLIATAGRPDNCSSETRTCFALPGETAAQLDADRADAQAADDRRTLGLVAGGVGIAALAGGLLWHFLEPTGPSHTGRSGGLRLAPWSPDRSPGLGVSGVF